MELYHSIYRSLITDQSINPTDLFLKTHVLIFELSDEEQKRGECNNNHKTPPQIKKNSHFSFSFSGQVGNPGVIAVYLVACCEILFVERTGT